MRLSRSHRLNFGSKTKIVGERGQYPTIAAALAAAASGDLVYVLPGLYPQTTSLIVPAGVTLYGFSRYACRLTMAEQSVPLVQLAGNDINICGLSIKETHTTPAGGMAGIHDGSVARSNINIRDCILRGDWDTIMAGSPGSGRWVVDSCFFDDASGDVINSAADPFIVQNCTAVLAPTFPASSTYNDATFLVWSGGNPRLLGNIFQITRAAGLGHFAYVSKRSSPAGTLLSSGNQIIAVGNNNNFYGLNASGSGSTAGGDNGIFRSYNDVFDVTTSGTIGHIRVNTKSNNQWHIVGGNVIQIAGTVGNNLVNVVPAFGRQDLAFDGVVRSELRDVTETAAGIKAALLAAGLFHATTTALIAAAPTIPWHTASFTVSEWAAIGGPSVVMYFDAAVTGLTAGMLTVNGSAATAVTGSGKGPYVFTGFTVPTPTPDPGTTCDITLTDDGTVGFTNIVAPNWRFYYKTNP